MEHKVVSISLLLLTFIPLIDKSCAAGLYECETEDDCVLAEAECVNNYCTCPPGKLLSDDGRKCFDYATDINQDCEFDEQCALLEGNARCLNGKCLCPDGFIYLKRSCIKKPKNNYSCQHNDDCFDGNNYNSRTCVNKICQCSPGFYSRGDVDCRKLSGIGQSCAFDLDCVDTAVCQKNICEAPSNEKRTVVDITDSENDDIETFDYDWETHDISNEAICKSNSECKDQNEICSPILRKCTCRKGYFLYKNKCTAELGMTCKVNEDCIESNCEKGICSCPKSAAHYNSVNRKCMKLNVFPRCSNDESCKYLVNNYYCDLTMKECKCKGPDAEINSDFYCNSIQQSCNNEADCTTIKNSVCEQSLCVCLPNTELREGICQPKVTGKCDDYSDCKVLEENAECKNGICSCMENYVPHLADLTCLSQVNLNQTCTIEEQCKQKWNSTCQDNKCICEKRFLNVKGNCLMLAERVGDYCTHPSVCMENTVCEKSKCMCSDGMRVTPSKRGCYIPRNNGNTKVADSLCLFVILIIVTYCKIN